MPLLTGITGLPQLQWGPVTLTVKGAQLEPPVALKTPAVLKTRSPILIKAKQDRYLLPDDDGYVDALLANIRHKADLLGLPGDAELEVLEAGRRRLFTVSGGIRIGAIATLRIDAAPSDHRVTRLGSRAVQHPGLWIGEVTAAVPARPALTQSMMAYGPSPSTGPGVPIGQATPKGSSVRSSSRDTAGVGLHHRWLRSTTGGGALRDLWCGSTKSASTRTTTRAATRSSTAATPPGAPGLVRRSARRTRAALGTVSCGSGPGHVP